MIISELLKNKFESKAESLLLTNEIGGFFLFSQKKLTKYQGLFFKKDNEVYKSINNITINEKIKQIIYRGYEIEINYGKFYQKFFMPVGKDAIIYETNYEKNSFLFFDCRKAYDLDDWGRFYNIYVEDDAIIIEYSKKSPSGEISQGEYNIYTAIVADSISFQKIDEWLKEEYSFDANRNDSPIRYVYKALSLKAKKIVITSSLNKKNAIENARNIFLNEEKLKKEVINNSKKFLTDSNSKLLIAHMLSLRAIFSLKAKARNFNGFYAGLPWFFQFWTRDNAFAMKILFKYDFNFAKDFLLFNLTQIREDGLIPTILESKALDSIDSAGLVFLRLKEAVLTYEKEFKKEELKIIAEKLNYSIKNILISRLNNGLITNKKFETWMDSIERDGARIEIQALQISMNAFLKELAKILNDLHTFNYAQKKEQELIKNVRKNFFNGDILYDGLSDKTIRPNIFLANYFFQDLLTKDEWEKVFDFALKSLWLDWGGLATIDKKNISFCSKHSGIDNRSYHNGDSWFFLNNLAAIVLYRTNRKKYRKFIDRIILASAEEILNKGIFGFHAELSSAKKLEANGCLAQLWSSSIYVELIEEIYKLR